MSIKDIDDFDNNKKSVEKFVKSADMTKTSTRKNIGGRPKKKESERANSQVFINLTEEQKKKLVQYSNNMGISASAVVKMLLSKEGII